MKKNKYFDRFLKYLYNKDVSNMDIMFQDGFDINSLDEDGRTMLMYSILDSEPNVDIVNYLILKGSNINIREKTQGWSALHFATRDNKYNLVKLLLENGAKVDIVDEFGNTPLLRAVQIYIDDSKMINELLKYQANPLKLNNSGISPLKLATIKNNNLGNKNSRALINLLNRV